MEEIEKSVNKKIIMFLVGNKFDLEAKRQVTENEGIELGMKYDIQPIK